MQENLIAAGKIPYTIVRATQFFEFLGGIAQGRRRRPIGSPAFALMQALAADDVAALLADYTLGRPSNRIVDIAGPESMGIDEAVRRFLVATGDIRQVITRSQSALLRRKGQRKLPRPRQGRPPRPHTPRRVARPAIPRHSGLRLRTTFHHR